MLGGGCFGAKSRASQRHHTGRWQRKGTVVAARSISAEGGGSDEATSPLHNWRDLEVKSFNRPVSAGSITNLGVTDGAAKGETRIAKERLMQPNQKNNRLTREKSPYLLQHADNPVDWYPWGPEAFDTARREDKPIFLSIGYSTCHWCHVMEHESFEDEAVAQVMNETFISIKVDREERPDIDNIYMAVCQMMAGSGGWPLTIIMTPEKQPFFAGTYFPKETRQSRMGMLDLVPRVADVWKNRRQEILDSAEHITAALRELPSEPGEGPDVATMELAFDQLESRFDSRHGGFGPAPKFPSAHSLLFLLRYWKRTGEAAALAMVERTLTAMRSGGIFDQIGYGFHRYSTDAQWLLPHFEKMLYDQAMLAMAYTEAFQATRKPEFETAAREILTYVLRDMQSPEGGFYSAEDADSEGEEGKFYVWSVAEGRSILSAGDADLFIRVFGLTPEGNFLEQATQQRTGHNIPHLASSLEMDAQQAGMSESSLRERIESIRRTLFAIREKRVHPLKDDKILADWNGLMIAALSKAAQAFGDHAYAAAAGRAAEFILAKLHRDDGRLLHRWRDGDAAVLGTTDDYAFLIWGLLELYEATFDATRLETAIALNEEFVRKFWDGDNGGFFFTAADAEDLIARKKEPYDGAIPSGNSVAVLNLFRLARITGQADLESKALAIGRAFGGDVARQPSAYAMMLCAADFGIGPAAEVVIVGNPEDRGTQEMLLTLRAAYEPNKTVILRPASESNPAISQIAEFTRAMGAINGRETAYVCRNHACQRPTNDPAEMLRLLDES